MRIRLVAVVTLVAVALLLITSMPVPSVAAPQAATIDRSREAQQTLDSLVEIASKKASVTLTGHRSPSGSIAAPDEGSRRAVQVLVGNGRRLDPEQFRLRYVDEGLTDVPMSIRAKYGDRAWSGAVEVRYRLAPYQTHTLKHVTEFVFVEDHDTARIAAIGIEDWQTPIWLNNPVSVARTARTLVISARGAARGYTPLAVRAVRDVHAVLPAFDGPLVVEVPTSQQALEKLLAEAPGTEQQIVGETVAVERRAAVPMDVVYLNPATFERIIEAGQQMIMTHETTHVATRGTRYAAPKWLSEGFADYVGQLHLNLPFHMAAGQFLAMIRAEGAPTRLPNAADFAPLAPRLNVAYEEAWSVCRFIAERWGQRRLVELYQSVNDGQPVGSALQLYLGLDEPQFVAAWRGYLTELANQ